MGYFNYAVDHFRAVEHGLDILRIGKVEIVKHEAKIASFLNRTRCLFFQISYLA